MRDQTCYLTPSGKSAVYLRGDVDWHMVKAIWRRDQFFFSVVVVFSVVVATQSSARPAPACRARRHIMTRGALASSPNPCDSNRTPAIQARVAASSGGVGATREGFWKLGDLTGLAPGQVRTRGGSRCARPPRAARGTARSAGLSAGWQQGAQRRVALARR